MKTKTQTLYSLSEEGALDDVGGKAHSLQKMHALGLRIPPGVVVAAKAFAEFSAPLMAEIERHQDLVDKSSPTSAQRASESIQRLIESTPVPGALCRAITQKLAGHEGPFIVRSSAVGEDSAEASFAGQLDSYFPIEKAGIAQALRRCWASAFTARSLAYQAQRNVRLRGIAVIVQELIHAEHAGVLFTDAIDLRGEYCAGFGEALVSGRITPGQFRISRDSAKGRHLSQLVVDKPYKDETEAATKERAKGAFLSEIAVHALAHGATLLESRGGQAMDIEWATNAEGVLYFVQARPVTAPATTLWSNANICENFPGKVTPLLYSVARVGYEHYFRNLAIAFGLSRREITESESAFKGIIGAHQGRLYYNLSNIHAVFRLAPFGDTFVDAFNTFVGAPSSNKRIDRERFIEAANALKLMAFGAKAFASLPKRIERFETRVDVFAEKFAPHELEHMSEFELEQGLSEFISLRKDWLDPSLCDGAAMLSYAALKRFVRQVSDDEGMLHRLLKGIDGLASAAPIEELFDLAGTLREDNCASVLFDEGRNRDEVIARFKREAAPKSVSAFNDYLERWGFRGSGELMLTEPSFQEDPALLLPILKRYVQSHVASPSERLGIQRQERLDAARALKSSLTGRWRAMRKPFEVLLRMTHASIKFRERARLKQALLYSRLRRVALRLGETLEAREVLENKDDIFMLELDEIRALIQGRAFFGSDVKSWVLARRESQARFIDDELPETFSLPKGELASPPMQKPTRRPAKEGEWLGIAASSGRVIGRAAVLAGLEESGNLEEHDLLVTRQTDPGWAPLFFLIDGLVMERGGMLSHGSILAREFGIPSVVGIDDVLTRIPHGASIEVNGSAGTVKRA